MPTDYNDQPEQLNSDGDFLDSLEGESVCLYGCLPKEQAIRAAALNAAAQVLGMCEVIARSLDESPVEEWAQYMYSSHIEQKLESVNDEASRLRPLLTKEVISTTAGSMTRDNYTAEWAKYALSASRLHLAMTDWSVEMAKLLRELTAAHGESHFTRAMQSTLDKFAGLLSQTERLDKMTVHTFEATPHSKIN